MAHNLAFDKPVIRAAAYAEWIRGGGSETSSTTGGYGSSHSMRGADLREIWPAGLREFCTMTATRDVVRIPSPYYGPESGKFKAPRLNELYTWLYGHVYDISGAVLHTSSSDTHCLSQCLSELIRRGIVVAEGGGLKVVTAAETSPVIAGSSPASS